MSFTLSIENLEFSCIIGILEKERLDSQKVICKALITYKPDIKKLQQNDFSSLLDYAQIALFIQNDLQQSKYGILEVALFSLAHKLKKEFASITSLSLSIKKPQILAPSIVGARIQMDF